MTLYEQWVELENRRLGVAMIDHPIYRAALSELTRQSIALQKAMGWRNIKTKAPVRGGA